MSLRFVICDVFTDRPYAGNPLAIVEGADGLTDGQMQAMAAEFNLSETIFLSAPRDPAHTARARIFMPKGEIPFAGHPTIGAALHLAQAGTVWLEEEAGLVEVALSDGLAELRAPRLPVCGAALAPEAAAAALGLAASEIGFGAHRPGLASGGPCFAFVPVASLAALSRATPAPGFGALIGAADSAYLYTPAPGGFRARLFSPGTGIAEDPATGSAAALLAARLLEAGALAEGESRFTITQGVEMGRPSQIGLRILVACGALAAVHVAGRAVPVAEGRITPPNA